jgi:hypothetical protein
MLHQRVPVIALAYTVANRQSIKFTRLKPLYSQKLILFFIAAAFPADTFPAAGSHDILHIWFSMRIPRAPAIPIYWPSPLLIPSARIVSLADVGLGVKGHHLCANFTFSAFPPAL